jgi:hypothetical protein
LRFLALISREPFDYQEWRREYFSRYGVDDLLEAPVLICGRAGSIEGIM